MIILLRCYGFGIIPAKPPPPTIAILGFFIGSDVVITKSCSVMNVIILYE